MRAFVHKFSSNAPGLLIIAAFFFTGMSACVKALSPAIPLYETVFARSIVPVFIVGALMYQRSINFRAQNFPLMVTRALSGLGGMMCNFYALGKLSLGDVAVLFNTFPIFVALLSFLFLNEKPTKKLLFLILLSMIGIFILLQPQLDFFNFAGLIALLGAFFSAVVVVVIRQSHETEPSLRITFYFMAICAFITAPVMMQNFAVPDRHDFILLLGAGLFGTFGQVLMTHAYSLGDVSRLSPFAYTGVIFSFIAGIFFWGEIPNILSIVGSAIILICCVQIARLEKPKPMIDGAAD